MCVIPQSVLSAESLRPIAERLGKFSRKSDWQNILFCRDLKLDGKF